MTRDRFGSFCIDMRTPEDKWADEIRRRHEDDEADCVEDCPICLEQNEPVSLCCGEPMAPGGHDICSFCRERAMFKIPVKGF
jgi:hypothetical protein